MVRRVTQWYAQDHLDQKLVSDLLLNPEDHHAIETGKLKPDDFLKRCTQLLGVAFNFHVLKEIWCDIFLENLPAIDIVKQLQGRSKLVLLSNTNSWHIEFIRQRFTIIERFDEVILSHEVGLRKPDPDIYRHAIHLALPNASIFYIDDILEYVEAASKMGIIGIHYTDTESLRMQLTALGVLL